MRVALLVLLLAVAVSTHACEQGVVLSEHLEVDSPKDYYLVTIRRAHGSNLVATVQRSFGGAWSAGQTVTIQLEQQGLADAGCQLEARAGDTWLFRTRSLAGALQVSPFDSRNVPEHHERFATYVRDVEAAVIP